MLHPKSSSQRRWQWAIGSLVFIVALGLLTYGFSGMLQRWHYTHNPHPTVSKKVVTYSTSTPDETPDTDACDSYNVPAWQPRKIIISSIGVNACIERVGVDQNHAVAVPTSIYLAGWYANSALPGQPGVSLVDGHVLGRYNDAIFKNLKELSAGDVITIQMGDLSTISYTVKTNDTYSLAQVPNEMLSQLPGVQSQLTLITCGGNFNPQTITYDHRVIVRASLIRNQSS